MTLFLGTSGWQYDHWRETFYPPEVKPPTWLEHYAERFQTVEVNNTFYRLPPAKTFEAWERRSTDDFVFVLKVSRYLTHIKRLKEAKESVALFLERAKPLGRKTGPFLVQLPPNLQAEPERLRDTLRQFPSGARVAVEFRHDSWYTDEVKAVLEEHGATLCLADRGEKVLGATWRTAEWGYVRFHHGRARPEPCYRRRTLESWMERIAERWSPQDDVYVFFNNDPLACALRDVIVFAEIAERSGYAPTRVPPMSEVTVG